VLDYLSDFFYDPLDYISNFFYDPWTFWGVPLLFALLWESYRRFTGVPFRHKRPEGVAAGRGDRSDRP
jgi:hypothetical protein